MFSKKRTIIECLQRRFILECSGTKCATEKLSGFEYVMQNGHFPRVFAKHRSVIPRMFTEKRSVCIAFRKSWVFSGYSGFCHRKYWQVGLSRAVFLVMGGGGVGWRGGGWEKERTLDCVSKPQSNVHPLSEDGPKAQNKIKYIVHGVTTKCSLFLLWTPCKALKKTHQVLI